MINIALIILEQLLSTYNSNFNNDYYNLHIIIAPYR